MELYRATCDTSDGSAEEYWESYRECMLFSCMIWLGLMMGAVDVTDPEAAKALPVMDTVCTNVLSVVDDLELVPLAKTILATKKLK